MKSAQDRTFYDKVYSRVIHTYTRHRFGGPEHHPLVRSLPKPLRRQAVGRFAHSRTHGFFYMRVPKSANSTVCLTLVQPMPERRDRVGVLDSRRAKAELPRISSMSQFPLWPAGVGQNAPTRTACKNAA